MSSSPPEQPPRQPVSRAAELAAQQVESIVEAAQSSAIQVTEAAQQEAEQVRTLARESARADVESARKEATERIAEAQAAADDVLAEAKAVSGGMRQLAHLLTTHAERILRDVQNSHRAISADLRAAGAGEPRPSAPDKSRDEPEDRQPRRAGGGDNPFADLEPPDWVEETGDAGRRGG